eukprot:TRINITY_DN21208_c0_g1_i1.p1 TRINITY_DN21208_c0_g1~~TRINITY_DN21208_c0_g1_i1.p1  ORF type:complete len:554 (-),score=123.81 TRINITY_DN21208_c0_g1_i1:255-1916(-)
MTMTLYDDLARTHESLRIVIATFLSVKPTRASQPRTSDSLASTGATSPPPPPSPSSAPSIAHLTADAAVLLINLRQLNRLILNYEEEVKLQTERAKAPVDSTTLHLHNLLYEQNHYAKAIQACKDFRTKFPDIELVPEEEFAEEAPQVGLDGGDLKGDKHLLMIQRLKFELHQRGTLAKERDVLAKRKRELQDDLDSKKGFLSSLSHELKIVKEATLPLQTLLGNPHSARIESFRLAHRLPPPLYILYSQLVAHKEVFGDAIEVAIAGAMESTEEEELRSKAEEESNGGVSKLSNDEEHNPEDDDQSRRRHKRAHRSKESSPAPSLLLSSTPSHLEPVHPLYVTLSIFPLLTSYSSSDKSQNCQVKNEGGEGLKEQSPISTLNSSLVEEKNVQVPPPTLLVIKFDYLPHLDLVCAAAVEAAKEAGKGQTVLSELFPNDDGSEPPNPALKLHPPSTLAILGTHPGRPYKWAQHLSGLDFLPALPPTLLSSLQSLPPPQDSSAQELSSSPVSQKALPSGEDVIKKASEGLDEYRKEQRVEKVLKQLRAHLSRQNK